MASTLVEGTYALELVSRGVCRVVGVDASADMVRLATARVTGPVEFHGHDL